MTPTTTAATIAPVPDLLETIDALLSRFTQLAGEAARLREIVEDTVAAQRKRETEIGVTVHGRNEHDRRHRLVLLIAADEQLSRLRATEREVRRKLAETEATLWNTKFKARACLALLKLAADAGPEDEANDAEGDGV